LHLLDLQVGKIWEKLTILLKTKGVKVERGENQGKMLAEPDFSVAAMPQKFAAQVFENKRAKKTCGKLKDFA
jgi:hypothetical protein